MHYKAGEYFQIVAVEAELLFSQLLEFVAQSEIRMALAAESIVYEERGYCCDPYFVLGPETKPNHRRYRAPSAGVLLLFFRFLQFQCNHEEVRETNILAPHLCALKGLDANPQSLTRKSKSFLK